MLLPCPWTIRAGKGLGELLIPSPHFTSEETDPWGFAQGLPPMSPTSTVPPAASFSSFVECFPSAAQVSPLASAVGRKFSKGNNWVYSFHAAMPGLAAGLWSCWTGFAGVHSQD